MSTMTKSYATIKAHQLRELIKDVDDDKEVRIWVEQNVNDSILLEGRRLVGVLDDPQDRYLCLVAGYYQEDEVEE